MKHTERSAHQHTSEKDREYVYVIHKSQQNARTGRYRDTDVSSGADDDNVLISVTFEKTSKLLLL